MILIGEKINSSIKNVYKAIEEKNKDFIESLVISQQQAGVSYLDVNAGAFLNDEYEKLCWLLDVVSGSTSLPLMIDTPNEKIALKICEKYSFDKKPIINSITLESSRFENMLAAVKSCSGGVVALCMDNGENLSCIKIADKLVNKLVQNGVNISDIYVDPMITPLGSDDKSALNALKNISEIRKLFPNVHITCGLSNISFGLPKRSLINRTFLLNAMTSGLDSAIINPLDKELMANIYAQNLILGKDEYCMEYIQAIREEKF